MTSWDLAIDFGTSNTVAAVASGSNVAMVDLESNGRYRLPSCVFLSPDGEILVGTEAQQHAISDPADFVPGLKLHLGESEILLGDRLVAVADLLGAVLRATYMSACTQQGGTTPAIVGFTHPAGWTNARKRILKQAVERAGIATYEFIDEPIAAAMRMGGEQTYPGQIFAVYDFGGGTFDAAVLRRTVDGFEMAGPPAERDPLGGEDIDFRIVEYLGEQLREQHPQEWSNLLNPPEASWRQKAAELHNEVRRAKETLSEERICQLWVPGIETEEQLSRDELEKVAESVIDVTVDCLQQALNDANVNPKELAGLYLVGGSSQIPLVRSKLYRRLEIMPNTSDNPKSVVALGAASMLQTSRAPSPASAKPATSPTTARPPSPVTGYPAPAPAPAPPPPQASPPQVSPPEFSPPPVGRTVPIGTAPGPSAPQSGTSPSYAAPESGTSKKGRRPSAGARLLTQFRLHLPKKHAQQTPRDASKGTSQSASAPTWPTVEGRSETELTIIPTDLGSGSGDEVECTIYSPASAPPGGRILVQVWAHLDEQANEARTLAREFDQSAIRRSVQTLMCRVARGQTITFELSAPGLIISPSTQQLVWRGTARPVQFDVSIPSGAREGEVAIATLIVSLGSVPIGHIKYRLTISTGAAGADGNHRQSGETARRYSKAFASYATPDRVLVLERLQMLTALNVEYFQDIESLSPGDRWKEELYSHIDSCDLFLLFWSSAARESEWVRREVRYALQRKGDDEMSPPEICPVIIEGPPVPKPWDELSHLHFNDRRIYLIAAQR